MAATHSPCAGPLISNSSVIDSDIRIRRNKAVAAILAMTTHRYRVCSCPPQEEGKSRQSDSLSHSFHALGHSSHGRFTNCQNQNAFQTRAENQHSDVEERRRDCGSWSDRVRITGRRDAFQHKHQDDMNSCHRNSKPEEAYCSQRLVRCDARRHDVYLLMLCSAQCNLAMLDNACAIWTHLTTRLNVLKQHQVRFSTVTRPLMRMKGI